MAVRHPQGQHRGGDDRRDDGGRHGARAQPVAAGGPVLRVQREARAAEARGVATGGVQHRRVRGGSFRHDERQGRRGGRCDGGAGPGARRSGPLGDPAAARAVVHVPDEFAAERRGEQDPVVAGEPGDARAVAGLDDGEGRPGPLHLAGSGGQQLAGSRVLQAEHGGDFARAEAVAYREFQRLALLGGGAGGLGPGKSGEIAALPLGGLGSSWLLGRGRGLGLRRAPGVCAGTQPLPLGELAQTGPAREGVQPGPAALFARGAAAELAFRDGEHLAEYGGGLRVVAQNGEAVGEKTVQICLVTDRRPLFRRVGGAPVRPVCAGGVCGVLQPAARHPATVGR